MRARNSSSIEPPVNGGAGSDSRCGVAVAFGNSRRASTAARPTRLGIRFARVAVCTVRLAADCRRQDVERDRLAIAVHSHRTVVIVTAIAVVRGLLVGIARAALARSPLRTIAAVAALGALATVVAAGTLLLGSVHHLVVAVLVVHFVVAGAALIFEPRAALAEHAIIVIGILEIIFGLNAIARELRVPRHVLIFLEQLSGIAALAVIGPVARLSSAGVLAPLPPAAATAATLLSVVDQNPHFPNKEEVPLASDGQSGAGRSALERGSDPLVPVCAWGA
jgi:hypothetical protein